MSGDHHEIVHEQPVKYHFSTSFTLDGTEHQIAYSGEATDLIAAWVAEDGPHISGMANGEQAFNLLAAMIRAHIKVFGADWVARALLRSITLEPEQVNFMSSEDRRT